MLIDAKLLKRIETICSESMTPEVGFFELLKICKEKFPAARWETFEDLKIKPDLDKLIDWIVGLLKTELPTRILKGIWFGLFQSNVEGIEMWELYVGGTEISPKQDCDWMSKISKGWWPRQRYANSNVLIEISKKLANLKVEERQYAEYLLVLGYSGLVVRQIIQKTNFVDLLSTGSNQLSIHIGFDEGDFIRIKDD